MLISTHPQNLLGILDISKNLTFGFMAEITATEEGEKFKTLNKIVDIEKNIK